MKLFIWNEPYQVPYGMALLIVVAESLEKAKLLAVSKAAKAYSFGIYSREWNGWDAEELREPTRVLDLPCAEWHEWSE